MNDIEYWENYYKKNKTVNHPSLFVKYCVDNFLQKHNSILELGCGNGRDSLYLAEKGMNVIALDQCEEEINTLKKTYLLKNLSFLTKDFVDLSNMGKFNAIYSRFTLHAITEENENKLFANLPKHLNNKGYFFVEARGLKNEYYGKGTPLKNKKDTFFYEGHTRRFININNVCDKLKKYNLKIIMANEDYNFAPFNNTNYKFIRIVAQK